MISALYVMMAMDVITWNITMLALDKVNKYVRKGESNQEN